MKSLPLILIIILAGCHPRSPKEITFDFGEYKLTSEVDHLLKTTKDGGFAATEYSFISEHEKLNEAIILNARKKDRISPESWQAIQAEYKFKDAISHIIKEAANHEFLLINEAHYIPQHRNFVRQLLPHLSKLGYKYLALEAIGMMTNGERLEVYDKELEERGYPATRTGLYIKEPEFGNLIREAIALDFKIIGYDKGSGEEREMLGAKNILKAKKNYGSKGKTIVLCGWDHIKEGETGTYWEYALAERIQQLTWKNPLTVNQTAYYERANSIYEDSIYQWTQLDKPMVLLNREGESFDVQKNKDWYDLFVFHPRTKYSDGFPDWLVKSTTIVDFKLPAIDMDCPCKIFVYDKNDEVGKAVPLYIIEKQEIKEGNIKVPTVGGRSVKVVVSNKKESWLVE